MATTASGWSGAIAKRQGVTNPKGTVYSIKRFMGRRLSEVPEEMSLVPYEVIEGKDGSGRVKVERQDLHAAGDLGDGAAEAEGSGRGLPRRGRSLRP